MFKKFVIKKSDAQVEDFKLKEFSLRVTNEAKAFEKSEFISSNDFVINESSAKKSGLSYLKDKRISNDIDEKVKILLEEEKAKVYQEFKKNGYEEGFQAGIIEGKESVVSDYKEAVESAIETITALSQKVAGINKEIIKENEADLVNLIKLATRKFCLQEMSADEGVVKNLINQTLEEHAKENKIKCTLSVDDFAKLTKFNDEIKTNSLPKEVSFEASENVSSGGLLVEVDNGKVDKTIETRFEKIWKALSI